MARRLAALVIAVGLAACQTTSPDEQRRQAALDELSDVVAAIVLCQADAGTWDAQARIDACTRLIERGEPKDAVIAAYNNRANLHRHMGRDAEALKDYNEALGFFPDAFPLLSNRGKLLSDQGLLGPAEQDFRAALALAPDNPIVLNNLAWVLLQRGEYAAGLGLAEEAIASQVEPTIGYDTKAHALMGLGRKEAAEAAFMEVAKRYGSRIVGRYQAALARKGYNLQRSDGLLDDSTRAALRACIRDNCRLLLD